MGELGDVRCVALPIALLASALQYARFAKKPMAFPCQWVTERLSRRFVIIGLVLELIGLRLLPLSCAYPMNASCLLLLYFWKETKRSGAATMHSFGALAAWALPFVDPAGSELPVGLEAAPLAHLLLDPATCAYAVALLGASALVHLLGGCCPLGPKGSPQLLLHCAPAALNFGVSAILLKALAHLVSAAAAEPGRWEIWASLLALAALLLGVRSAAAVPLRRAMEAHDNLGVLSGYGATSSAAAVATGALVYGELGRWGFERKAVFALLVVAHCWGMRGLGQRGIGGRGGGSKRDDDRNADPSASALSTPTKEGPAGGGGRRDAASAALGGTVGGGSSGSLQAVERPGGVSAASSKAAAGGGQLLDFAGGGAGRGGTAAGGSRAAADMEDQLFARALAPARLAPAMNGAGSGAAASSSSGARAGAAGAAGAPAAGSEGHMPDAGAGGSAFSPDFAAGDGGVTPGFDADFDEILRRLGEEDEPQDFGPGVRPVLDLSEHPIGGGSPGSGGGAGSGQRGKGGRISSSDGAASTAADAAPVPGTELVPEVLQFDAQTLMDEGFGGQDDEDELLRSIRDIDGP